MRIIRDRGISEDLWLHAPEGAHGALTDTGAAVTVALADWRQGRARLVGREAPTGVRIGAVDGLDEIVHELDAIALVVFEFSSFTEGRAYSHARILRERHGYRGEIRARGDVSRDRLAFMERCGFNAFELRAEEGLREALDAFDEISAAYQPAADGRPVIPERRA